MISCYDRQCCIRVPLYTYTGIDLCMCLMCLANERWRYNVTSSLIAWAHAQNDAWYIHMIKVIFIFYKFRQMIVLSIFREPILSVANIPSNLDLIHTIACSSITCSHQGGYWQWHPGSLIVPIQFTMCDQNSKTTPNWKRNGRILVIVLDYILTIWNLATIFVFGRREKS